MAKRRIDKVSLLQRREIEAQIAAPLFNAFTKDIGRERTAKIFERVIKKLAKSKGAELAKLGNGNSLKHFAKKILPMWCEGGALDIELLQANETCCSFNVIRCKYAEMYRRLGLQEYGSLLSCSRDAAFIRGFNSKLAMRRTHTIMKGAPICGFQISVRRS